MATDDQGRPPQQPHRAPQPPWWEQGEEPDYRATLANERTFLAWSRTALALLAGALAVLQLVDVAPFGLRLALACYLIALSVTTIVIGYHQWRTRQQRMRHRGPLGHRPFQALLGIAFLVLAALVATVAAYSPR
jgi:putative membrane protein